MRCPVSGLGSRYPSSTLFPFFGVSLLKLNLRKQGTLIVKGLLENLEKVTSSWGPRGAWYVVPMYLLGT